jgi:hypothetical protein
MSQGAQKKPLNNKLHHKISMIMEEEAKTHQVIDKKEVEISDSEADIDNYQMLSNEFDFDELKEDPSFGIKGYKDSIYKGCLEGRKRQGKGVCINNNGRVYEGDWEKDKRAGHGYEFYPNGNFY